MLAEAAPVRPQAPAPAPPARTAKLVPAQHATKIRILIDSNKPEPTRELNLGAGHERAAAYFRALLAWRKRAPHPHTRPAALGARPRTCNSLQKGRRCHTPPSCPRLPSAEGAETGQPVSGYSTVSAHGLDGLDDRPDNRPRMPRQPVYVCGLRLWVHGRPA
eukprot:6180773-Pleurochrysis_carterae.AAC.7